MIRTGYYSSFGYGLRPWPDLTAGIYLAEPISGLCCWKQESFGGKIKNVEWIENYPGFADGVSGAQLANQMEAQAMKYGLKTEMAKVSGIEIFSESRWVACSDGRGYTTAVVIMAGGSKPKRLNVPGERICWEKVSLPAHFAMAVSLPTKSWRWPAVVIRVSPKPFICPKSPPG